MGTQEFAIGEKIGPYTLLGKLARGGMGQIYRAQDGRLGREVAIKFLLAGEGEAELLRFQQEARTVGALAHPHVVTVFDVGVHERYPYIVSELLQGQTVRELLFRGPLEPAQAVRLTLQLLSGLDAAHAKGIIHRDLKPENLFLTTGGVLKILDFGIAKVSAHAAEGVAPLVRTRTGVVMGTVGYSAPEQLEARPVDVRTDLFSVGIVLHEMLLGEHPFAGRSRTQMADAILHQDLPPLPDSIPPALRAVVRRCEERQRERRFSSARELTAALEAVQGPPGTSGLPPAAPSAREPIPASPTAATLVSAGGATPVAMSADTASSTTVGPRGRAASGAGWSLAVVGLLLLVPAGAAWLLARSEGGLFSSARKARPSVAVLPLRAPAGDQAWMGGAAASLVQAGLAAGEKVRVARAEDVARVLAELGLQESDPPAEALARAGAALGVERLVTGAVTPAAAAGGVQLELRLLGVDGKAIATATGSGAGDQLAALAAKAGGQLREQLGAGPLGEVEQAEVRAALPQTPGALRSAALGEQHLRRFALGEARAQLAAAIAEAPSLAPLHALLAQVLEAAGDREGARAALQKAVELDAGLGREARLSFEARLRTAERDFPRAAEAWRALSTTFPDEPEYRLALARALGAAGQTAPALAALEVAATAKPDPRLALASGDIRAGAGELAAALADWQRAAEGAKAAGAGVLQADALLRRARAATGREPAEAALKPAQESLQLYKAAHHLTGALAASQVVGALLRMTGDVPAELARAEECAALADQTGAGRLQAGCLREQVQAQVLACDPQKALAADAAFRRLSAASGLDATEVVEQPGVLARFAAGRLAEAEAQLAAAEPRALGLTDRAGLVRLLLGPGDAFAPEASAGSSAARVGRAALLAEPLRLEPLAAQVKLSQARVALALGKPQARELASAAAAAFEKLGASAWEAQARATLARALLAAKAGDEAAEEATRAGALADRSRWRGAQLAAAEAQVAVHAAQAKRFALLEDARKLERLRDDAGRAGCVPERLGAEVAIARALRAADPGKPAAKVFAEARKLGYADLGREQ